MKREFIFASMTAWAVVAGGVRGAAVIYVDDSAPPPPIGANNGTSWANAFLNLRDALDIAAAGDEIRIAQGIYRPAAPNGPRDATFMLVSGADIQGGYAGFGAANPDLLDPELFATILSGDLNGNDGPDFENNFENSLHIVTASNTGPSTDLSGVTVRGGNASDPDGPSDGVGAAILCLGAGGLMLNQCTLEDNVAFFGGAGIFASGPSTMIVHLHDCIIRHNTNVSSTAGGVGASVNPGSSFTGCTFQDNVAVVASSAACIAGNGYSVTQCVFINNAAGEDGAAIFASHVTITHSLFIDNSSGYWGTVVLSGGACIVRNCLFESNSAGVQGGAIKTRENAVAEVSDCVFRENQASIGGAVDVSGTVNFIRCTFDDNAAQQGGGGAIANHDSATLINCTLRRNFATDAGGAIFNNGSLDAVNGLIAGNSAEGPGSAVAGFINADKTALTNCTVIGNQGPYAAVVGGPSSLLINNCILWDNQANGATNKAAQLSVGSGMFTLNHNCIMGWTGALGGTGNFGDDPMFINAPGADGLYGTDDENAHVIPSSPCLDAGDSAALPRDDFDLDADGDGAEPIPFDADGHVRISGAAVEVGAFETPTLGEPDCAADIAPLGGDGAVDGEDLLALMQLWGPCTGSCLADFNDDGIVDVDDLIVTVSNWGQCE